MTNIFSFWMFGACFVWLRSYCCPRTSRKTPLKYGLLINSLFCVLTFQLGDFGMISFRDKGTRSVVRGGWENLNPILRSIINIEKFGTILCESIVLYLECIIKPPPGLLEAHISIEVGSMELLTTNILKLNKLISFLLAQIQSVNTNNSERIVEERIESKIKNSWGWLLFRVYFYLFCSSIFYCVLTLEMDLHEVVLPPIQYPPLPLSSPD